MEGGHRGSKKEGKEMTKLNKREEFLVLFGTDSLANPRIWNIHDEEGASQSLAVDFMATYPMLLEQKLKAYLDRDDVVSNVYANRGSGYGMLTVRAADFFHFYFPKGNFADLTIFQAGISECWLKDDGLPRVSTEIFITNIEKIIDYKKRHNPESPSIFVSIMPTTAKYQERQPKQNEIIKEWNNIIKSHLIENCYYVDIEEFFYENEALQESMVHPDGHHLNIAGHEIYANLILDVIKTIP